MLSQGENLESMHHCWTCRHQLCPSHDLWSLCGEVIPGQPCCPVVITTGPGSNHHMVWSCYHVFWYGSPLVVIILLSGTVSRVIFLATLCCFVVIMMVFLMIIMLLLLITTIPGLVDPLVVMWRLTGWPVVSQSGSDHTVSETHGNFND